MSDNKDDTTGNTHNNESIEKKGFNHHRQNKPQYEFLVRVKVWTGQGNRDFNIRVPDLNALDKSFLNALNNDSNFIKINQTSNLGEIFNIQVKEGWELKNSYYRLPGSNDWQENKRKIQGLGKYKMTFVKVTQDWAKKIMVSFNSKNEAGTKSSKTIHLKNPKELDKLFDEAIEEKKDTFQFNEFNVVVQDGWNIARIDYVERTKNSLNESSIITTNNSYKPLEDQNSDREDSIIEENNNDKNSMIGESDKGNVTTVLDEEYPSLTNDDPNSPVLISNDQASDPKKKDIHNSDESSNSNDKKFLNFNKNYKDAVINYDSPENLEKLISSVDESKISELVKLVKGLDNKTIDGLITTFTSISSLKN